MKNPQLPPYSMLKNVSSKIRNNTSMSIPNTFIQQSFGSPKNRNQRRERKKGSKLEKGKTVTIGKWCAIDRKSWRCYQKTTWIHQWIMLLDTKLICRNLLYIYTKSEISEIKIKETLQYSIASKKKKNT